MIVKGNIHASPVVLGEYLQKQGENEYNGFREGHYKVKGTVAQDVTGALKEMDAFKRLTRAKYGLYHMQISPGIGEDQLMSEEDWDHCVATALKFHKCENQPHIYGPHVKEGRIHIHLVIQRYDPVEKKMLSFSNSYHRQDEIRAALEDDFGHRKTPRRNARRGSIRDELTPLWQQSRTGAEFVEAVNGLGYMLASGGNKRPLQVVDENARTYDLSEMVQDSQKALAAKLKGQKLPAKKKARQLILEAREKKRQVHAEQFSSFKQDFTVKQRQAKAVSDMKAEGETIAGDKGDPQLTKKQQAAMEAAKEFREREQERHRKIQELKDMLDNADEDEDSL